MLSVAYFVHEFVGFWPRDAMLALWW